MMKLGIIASPDRDGFELAKRHGLSCVEYCYNVGHPVDALWAKRDELKSLIAEYGIGVGSIGRWGSDKIDKDGGIIAEEFDGTKCLIDLCAYLGCPVFVTCVNYVKERTMYENVTSAINFLEKVVAYGEEKGVKVCVNNCDWNNFVTSPRYWELILGQIPALGIKYDPSHCIGEGNGDYLGEMKDWGDRFYHFHIKGMIMINGCHMDDPPAGLDMINWGAVMAVLYQKKYDGMLSIEPHSRTWMGDLSEPGIAFTADYMRKFIFERSDIKYQNP